MTKPKLTPEQLDAVPMLAQRGQPRASGKNSRRSRGSERTRAFLGTSRARQESRDRTPPAGGYVTS
jgi:hypothetical protein